MSSIYDFSAKSLDGKNVEFATYQGKVLLIVNTASNCGFTSQYQGLEQLYKKFAASGLLVLGFPCNQFGAQEPGNSTEIATFCTKNYGVSFPMFEKIEVNGDGAHSLYKYLQTVSPGVFGTEAIKWNFTKFLIDANGKPFKRYAPNVKPEELEKEIESLLSAHTHS